MGRKNNVFFYRKAKPGDYINTVTLTSDEKKRHGAGLRLRLPAKKEWRFRRVEKDKIWRQIAGKRMPYWGRKTRGGERVS
jgi:hypothetical protein